MVNKELEQLVNQVNELTERFNKHMGRLQPVKIGDEFRGREIVGLGRNGYFYVRIEGLFIFIPDANNMKVGDIVDITITNTREHSAFAELIV